MAHRSSRGGNSSGGFTNSNYFLEQQNDQMVDDLSSKVSALKRVTIAIGEDVREQNRLLDDLDSSFDISRGLLGSTMRKLGIASRAGGRNVLCYLVLFAFFVFLVVYYLAR